MLKKIYIQRNANKEIANQGTLNLKAIYKGKKSWKRDMSDNSVRQSINRRSVLPTAAQVKKEITGGTAAEAELNLDGVVGLS